jgi:hypothetical protein
MGKMLLDAAYLHNDFVCGQRTIAEISELDGALVRIVGKISECDARRVEWPARGRVKKWRHGWLLVVNGMELILNVVLV